MAVFCAAVYAGGMVTLCQLAVIQGEASGMCSSGNGWQDAGLKDNVDCATDDDEDTKES